MLRRFAVVPCVGLLNEGPHRGVVCPGANFGRFVQSMTGRVPTASSPRTLKDCAAAGWGTTGAALEVLTPAVTRIGSRKVNAAGMAALRIMRGTPGRRQ